MSTAALALADRTVPAMASLGSGSKGNGTLVQLGGELLLVDCGFGLRAVTNRLARLALRPADLTAILVSHEHSDHMQGVAALAHRYNIPVYASHGTLRACAGKLFGRAFTSDEPFFINAVEVTPVTVPHDAREPTQFTFSADGVRMGVLSDLGHVTAHVSRAYRDLDVLLLEANHDRDMLASGRYPPSVKRRVGGDLGHLANEQALALLEQIAHPGLQEQLGNISGENNHMERLQQLFEPLRPRLAALGYATQGEGHGWTAHQRS
ncbi:MAG: MBL fold metallo-hydrolase [Pseudomonadota bacterium]